MHYKKMLKLDKNTSNLISYFGTKPKSVLHAPSPYYTDSLYQLENNLARHRYDAL